MRKINEYIVNFICGAGLVLFIVTLNILLISGANYCRYNVFTPKVSDSIREKVDTVKHYQNSNNGPAIGIGIIPMGGRSVHINEYGISPAISPGINPGIGIGGQGVYINEY